MSNIWFIRAGVGNELIDLYVGGQVAIGWPCVGNLRLLESRSVLAEAFQKAYPRQSSGSAARAVSLLWRFSKEVRPDDPVVTYDQERRTYVIGTVTGEYRFANKPRSDYPHRRNVVWKTSVKRDLLPAPARRALGCHLTLYRPRDAVFRMLLSAERPSGGGRLGEGARVEKFGKWGHLGGGSGGGGAPSHGSVSRQWIASAWPISDVNPWFPRHAPFDQGPPSRMPEGKERPGPPEIDDQNLLQDPRNVPVWFGTNRKPVDPGNPGKGFTKQRDSQTHYGRCVVNIPKGHVTGDGGPGFLAKLFGLGEDRRLKLLTVGVHSEKEHWEELAKALMGAEPENKAILFFLHGYNVSFVDAATRTAQLGYDLKIRHLAFFSWPSKRWLLSYLKDEGSMDGSTAAVAAYLSRLAAIAQSAGLPLHVLAHSMGNRLLLRAILRVLAAAQAGQPSLRLAGTIFAAPDMDVQDFIDSVTTTKNASAMKTLYASHKDLPVWLSKGLHGGRAGKIPPITIAPDTATVDVTKIDLSLLGHGYVAEARPVITDMHELIHFGADPIARSCLHAATTDKNERYWRIE